MDKKIRNLLLGLGLTGAVASGSKLQAKTPDAKPIKPTGETEKAEGGKFEYTKAMPIEEVAFDQQQEVGGPDEGEEEMGPFTNSINIEKFYKTGTLEFVDEKAEEEALKSIENFLKDIDFNLSEIEIIGKYSADRAFKGLSQDESDSKNMQLAQGRAQNGVLLVKKALSRMGYSEEEIAKFIIKVEARGVSLYDSYTEAQLSAMSDQEKSALVDQNQGTEINLKVNKEIEKIVSLRGFDAVFADESASMKDDVEEVKAELDKLKETGKFPEYLKIEGGNTEAHIETLIKYLSNPNIEKSITRSKKLLVLTDEPDNSLLKEAYAKAIDRLIKLANSKNIKIFIKVFNPNKKDTANPYKIFLLNKYKDVLSQSSPFDGRLLTPDEWYKIILKKGEDISYSN